MSALLHGMSVIICPSSSLHLDVVLRILDCTTERDTNSVAIDRLRLRSALRSVCLFFDDYVQKSPRFWTDLIISPRVPISYVLRCLMLAAAERLHVTFIATEARECQPLTYGDIPCIFEDYVVDAARLLGGDMYRCEGLTIIADGALLVDDVLDTIASSTPSCLRHVTVTFPIFHYSQLRPQSMVDFEFAGPSPMLKPFRDFSTLCWTVDTVTTPTVHFSTTTTASCWLIHPSSRPSTWTEALALIQSTAQPVTLASLLEQSASQRKTQLKLCSV
ncbi:hypothetical protein DFH09DRAFT_1372569 [Mycena vulgaris]|nr:hypothetical protein DFH09DRAFT_1372569 [Mycena vulgaris]